MLISCFQTYEVASISVNTDPNNQFIGVHLKKVESQTHINPEKCVLLIEGYMKVLGF